MADDEARARRTTRATSGATKKAAVKKVAPPPVRKAATKKAAPAAKAPRAKKAAPGTEPAMPAKKAATAKRSVAAKKAAPAAKRTVAPKKVAPPAGGRGAVLAPRPKKAPSFRPAAEQTFDDDWEPPAPEPVREDPHARVRALLRAAALQVEGKAPAPAAPAPPAPPDEGEWLADDTVRGKEAELDEEVVHEQVEDDWDDHDVAADDEEDDWSPPEVLEEEEDEKQMPTVAAAPPPPQASTAPPAPPSAAAAEFTPPPFEAPTKAPAREKKGGRSRLKVLLIVIAALVALAALVAGAVWAYDKLRDEGVDYSELKVGDCFDSSASNEIRGIDVKSCSEPHNSEIFFIVTHPAGPTDAYPGKDALVQYAADNCLGQPLTDYLGIPLEQSKLKDFEIVPQESAWEDGRRALVCGLDTGGEGDITGSVKGARR